MGTTQPRKLAPQRSLILKIMSAQAFLFFTIATHLVCIFLSLKTSLFPGQEAIVSIVSSFAEIIAGLYGITMASYTFFLSRMDGLMAGDVTLESIVASVKRRFKYLIWFITFNVVLTLFTSIVLMYAPSPEGGVLLFLYRLFCNEFILSVASSILLILYYSLMVIAPDCLEKEAEKLRNRISFGEGGSAAEFISLYGQITARCGGLIPEEILCQLQADKGKRFAQTLELMQELCPEYSALLPELERVHRYYECMVNSSPMKASQEMCLLARGLFTQLEE